MFGFAGEHTLSRCMRLILVPASSVIADEVSTSARNSAVARLVGALMSEAVNAARVQWESKNKEQLQKLQEEVNAGVAESAKAPADRVNRMLTDLVPTATIDFVPETPTWSVKGDASIETGVVIDGQRRDVSRQGHGIQRAVMIAVLQALVPDPSPRQLPNGTDLQSSGDDEVPSGPALVICIEEPEIYQHPVRARHFARTLVHWSRRENCQVMAASHSPYFVLPEQFSSLRRFSLVDGETIIKSTTVEAVATAAEVAESKVRRAVEKELPQTFSEGFFADSVLFTEGDTDRVVIETLAERLGTPLDAKDIAVLSMGSKENLKIPFTLLDQLGVLVYVVADADADGALRKHPDDPARQAEAAGSHKKATEALIAWLPQEVNSLTGDLPYVWGEPTIVTSRWAILRDDLEAELELWPGYVASLATSGEVIRGKNVAAARAATLDTDLAGLTGTLKCLIETARNLGG